METMGNLEKALEEAIEEANDPYRCRPIGSNNTVIALAKKIGRRDIVEIYARNTMQNLEKLPLYFNNAGTQEAQLKLVPDVWQLDGCDSLELQTIQREYLQNLIELGDQTSIWKARRLIENISHYARKNKLYFQELQKRIMEKWE